MEPLEHVIQLTRLGRFGDALRALQQLKPDNSSRIKTDVLRAELFEKVGQLEQARALANALLKSKNLTAAQRSECEAVIGRILFDEGDSDGGLAHLQRAAHVAQQSNDLHALFGAKLPLLGILCDRSGPAAGSAILADVRQIATKLGDPEVTARLHLFVAQAEAKCGLLVNAKRHTSLARQILRTSPNAHLEAFTSNLDLANAVLLSEFDAGKECGFRAVELAEQSGVARIRRAVLGNMGNLFYELGDFDRATDYFERALAGLPSGGASATAILESVARIHLIQGRVDLCSGALDRIESLIRIEQDRLSYEQRYSALTRIHLLEWEGRAEEALARIDAVLNLADRAGDTVLLKRTQLAKAELLLSVGLIPSSMALIATIVPGLVGLSPELYGRSEQILACALAPDDDGTARAHYDRALRIYEALGSVPRQRELARSWNHARQRRRHTSAPPSPNADGKALEEHGARRTLHGIATALTHAARADLVARELLEILSATDCTYSARVTIQSLGENQPASHGTDSKITESPERRLSVGFRGDREIQLFIRPKLNVESVATVNALSLLLASLHEIQRSRAEREERATLWPIEDLPVDGERSVISGRMRELMNYARRIARSKVNVLITGESGTGKEILARAIHDFSDRAQKAFVPFNCTAIPRDLLESQLFGHRRGAFTGADRDQLGLIRTAREGTLFLDEVGELGLDLQPKLLRFLESGEISPLGEPGSLTIDVRIVAATNTNLEDAVRAGRFREDLFYRLNVVRLSIPPLRERRDEIPGFVNHFVARAAEEFRKGHLGVAEETMERLLLYRWPGNVRQLQNELRRMVALAEPDSTLLPHAISEEILGALPIFRHPPANGNEIAVGLHDKLTPTLARIECEMIKAALRTHHGKVDAVAKALGISRKGLYLKRQRLGL